MLIVCFACSRDEREEDDTQFREDVIGCEEAVARLVACCPDFDPRAVVCKHHRVVDKSGCDSKYSATDPALTIEETRCIRDATCAFLVTQAVCERAREAKPIETRSKNGEPVTTISGPRKQVCP